MCVCKIGQALSRYVRADAAFTNSSRLPYALYKTNLYGEVTVTIVPSDDEIFVATNMIAAVWYTIDALYHYFSTFIDFSSSYPIYFCRTQEGRDPLNFDYSQESITSPPKEESGERDGASSGAITLAQCFRKFAENEKLPDSETLYCSKCKEVNNHQSQF